MAITIERAQAVKSKTWPLSLIVAWLIWRRNRTGICIAAAGCVVGTVLAHTVLAGSLSSLNGTHITLATFLGSATSGANPISGPLLLWTLLLAFYYLQYISFIALRISWVWTYDRTKVALYPPHMLRAPATTTGLAVWPILCGIIMTGSFWLFNVQMVFRPMGYSAPFAGTAIALSLLLVFFAACTWSGSLPVLPFVSLPCFLCLLVFTAESFARSLSSPVYLCALALGCAAIGGAVKGLGALRCGAIYKWEWPSSLSWLKNLQDRKIKQPASPFAAFVDIDQAGTRSMSAGAWLMVLMAIILPSYVDFIYRTIMGSRAAGSVAEMDVNLGATAFVLSIFGILPVITDLLPGLVGSKQYLLSRPMPTQAIAGAKLWSVICGASRNMIAIVVVLICSASWQMHELTLHDGINNLNLGIVSTKVTKTVAVCVLLSLIGVYRWSINITSAAQSGNKFKTLVALLMDYFGSTVFLAITIGLYETTKFGSMVFVCSVAGVKLIAGVLSVLKVIRSGLIDRSGFITAGLTWVIAAAFVYAALLVVVPKNLSDPAALCALTLIAMPLVRLSLGPILLDRDRHR